jgi:hypothetical protein
MPPHEQLHNVTLDSRDYGQIKVFLYPCERRLV